MTASSLKGELGSPRDWARSTHVIGPVPEADPAAASGWGAVAGTRGLISRRVLYSDTGGNDEVRTFTLWKQIADQLTLLSVWDA
jgi:hypothetical protein